MNIKGVIFDKDGTLFDYAAVWGPIVSRAVDEGLSVFPVNYPDLSTASCVLRFGASAIE